METQFQAFDRDDDLSFDHAYCHADPLALARYILETDRALARQSSMVFNHFSRMLQPISVRRVYLWASPNQDCLLFMQANYTDMMLHISKGMQTPLHFMSVYAPMKVRLYLRFENGELVREILDPEKQIRTNIWRGEDMRGEGPRRFGSISEFMEMVRPFYVAKDHFWHIGRWENKAMRAEGLDRSDTHIRWSIELSGEHGTAIPTGQIPEYAQNWIVKLQ